MISLIITTYNRPSHLKRMLSFFHLNYENELKNFKIFILDSSYNKVLDKETNLLIHDLNILYFQFNRDLFVVQKIASITNQNNSDYSILLADDDIIDLARYMDYQKYLEKNHDYSCVIGLSLFDNFSRDLYYKNLKSIVRDYSIESSNYKDRIIKYSKLNNIGNPFYGIVRTELFNKVWSLMSKEIKFWYYPEIIYNYTILIHGKFKVFENLGSIRNFNEKLFNDLDSLKIMNKNNNKKALEVFMNMHKKINSHFIIDQLNIIKTSQEQGIAEKIEFNRSKDFLKKIVFSFFSKNIYYDKLDERSIDFYNKINKFYKKNTLNNLDIIESRKDYLKWM